VMEIVDAATKKPVARATPRMQVAPVAAVMIL